MTSNSPILIVPYMWIGDFVRCHTVVKLLKQRFPSRAIDLLTTSMVAPLLDYMPGCARAWWSTCRASAWLGRAPGIGGTAAPDGYGDALVMPRTWKSALAPYLAGIPARTGFFGEARFGLINDLRWGERRLPRMIDRCAVLALRKGEPRPPEWPRPELRVPAAEVAAWRQRLGLAADGRTVVAFAPGAVGASKRWPAGHYAELARRLAAAGSTVWVIGGPGEQELAAEIAGFRQDPYPGPHRPRPAQRHSRARGRRRRDLERFRPPARRRRDRDAGDWNFRPDRPVALGAAQSARGGD
jgi:heptosyltransferase-2